MTNKAIVELLFKNKEVITYMDIIELQNSMRYDLWHYHFHTFEPNEQGKISIENFLRSHLCSLERKHVERYRRQIQKVCKAYGDNDPGVSLEEYIAF